MLDTASVLHIGINFGMLLLVDLQIVVLQVIVDYVKPLWSEPILIKFLHYKLHTLLTNFLNALTYFSGCLLLTLLWLPFEGHYVFYDVEN